MAAASGAAAPNFTGPSEVTRRLTNAAIRDARDVDGIGPNLNPTLEGSVATSAIIAHTRALVLSQFHAAKGSPFRNIRTVQVDSGGAAAVVVTGKRAVPPKGASPKSGPSSQPVNPIPADQFLPALALPAAQALPQQQPQPPLQPLIPIQNGLAVVVGVNPNPQLGRVEHQPQLLANAGQPQPVAPQAQPQPLAPVAGQAQAAANFVLVRPQPGAARSLGDQILAGIKYICCCQCFKSC